MKRAHTQLGLTLIELMISVSIGIAMTGITLQIFIDNKQIARAVEANSRLQENGRFALDFLIKDIRRASAVSNVTNGITTGTETYTVVGNELLLDGSPLVEGIENIQILYGEDDPTDADNVPNYYVKAGTAGLNMANVVAVRISLLARSIENGITLNNQEYWYDHDGDGIATLQTAADKRLRRVFNSTIKLRNKF